MHNFSIFVIVSFTFAFFNFDNIMLQKSGNPPFKTCSDRPELVPGIR